MGSNIVSWGAGPTWESRRARPGNMREASSGADEIGRPSDRRGFRCDAGADADDRPADLPAERDDRGVARGDLGADAGDDVATDPVRLDGADHVDVVLEHLSAVLSGLSLCAATFS